MTTSPPSPEPERVRRSLPRQVRGYVQSYGQGRTCAEPACETTLSRYNKDLLCWKHAEQSDAAQLRRS
jgi:hypothetical protein